jgi:hypothetical protein
MDKVDLQVTYALNRLETTTYDWEQRKVWRDATVMEESNRKNLLDSESDPGSLNTINAITQRKEKQESIEEQHRGADHRQHRGEQW